MKLIQPEKRSTNTNPLRNLLLPTYLLGTYRITKAPESNSSRLTSVKFIRFNNPANHPAAGESKDWKRKHAAAQNQLQKNVQSPNYTVHAFLGGAFSTLMVKESRPLLPVSPLTFLLFLYSSCVSE
jgi:hypothetical protein